MMDDWQTAPVTFKFMLSDFVLFKRSRTLKIKPFEGFSGIETGVLKLPENVTLGPSEKGYLLRSYPLQSRQPVFRRDRGYIYYIPQQFDRYYIDLQATFEEYTSKFSSKTRSTIKRKIKKFSAQCEDGLHWESYKTVDEMQQFFDLARQVSETSYQEKLLDAGLPDTESFKSSIVKLAEQDLVRGYLLFDGKRPVAYMYCPVSKGTLIYQYLGYDPDYIKWSVGTILHWLAFEDIFNEKRYKYFDFTEGQSEHKRMYSTDSMFCGNVYIFPKSLATYALVGSHYVVDLISKTLGNWADQLGLKSKLKKIIRFGATK